MASPACALPVSRGSPVARVLRGGSSLRRSRRLRSHWRLSRARLAPRGAPEYISQSGAADCDYESSRTVAPARLMHPGARRGASRAGMPPTASEAMRAAGEEQQRQALATKERRLTVSYAPQMRLLPHRASVRGGDPGVGRRADRRAEGGVNLVGAFSDIDVSTEVRLRAGGLYDLCERPRQFHERVAAAENVFDEHIFLGAVQTRTAWSKEHRR